MTGEELYGRAMLELARKEGHRPMHLVLQAHDHQANGSKKRRPTGETADRLRAMDTASLTLKEAAALLGLKPQTVHRVAQRAGVTFRKEPQHKNFAGRAA